MDNKITKSRLSNFLAYEWILIILVAVVAIIGWELVYTMAGVRLTVGQTFKIYYDETISASNSDAFYDLFKFGTDDSIFSYDIIEVNCEDLTSDYNVLSVRLSTYEGDIIITDTAKGEEEGAVSRAEYILNNFNMYDLDSLCEDAETYLKSFIKNGESNALVYDNLDQNVIASKFKERMRKDNRFRGEENTEKGIVSENKRIKTLCEEVSFFKNFLENASDGMFYKYTVSETVGERRFGLKADAFTGGRLSTDAYFKNKSEGKSDGVVILAFDFLDFQPDLQFETISFMNMCIRNFTDFNPS